LRISFSSTVEGDLLIFLKTCKTGGFVDDKVLRLDLPSRRLCLLGNLQINPLLFCA
jgi:hypothetical protein